MKGYSIPLLALVLLLSLLLTGCTGTSEGEDSTAEAVRVALETALREEKEAHKQTKSRLEAQIEELQAELDALRGEDGSGGTPEGKMRFTYRIEEGAAILTKYEGTLSIVQIPATLDGYPVTQIGENAFKDNTHVTAVVVPDGVVEIGWFAFYGCEALCDVNLPESVKSIGHAVFDGCERVTVVCPKDSYAARYAKSYGLSLLER